MVDIDNGYVCNNNNDGISWTLKMDSGKKYWLAHISLQVHSFENIL